MASEFNQFDSVDEASSLQSRDARALIDRARNGCNDALSELIRSLQGYLLAVANQELNAELRAKLGASDLVQSVLIRAERNIAEFRGESQHTLLAWLRKILVHEIIAVHRQFVSSDKRDIRREISLEGDSRIDQPIMDPGRSPPSDAAFNEDAWKLRKAVEKLPVDYRTVVYLRNWEQLPFDEIARRLQRSTDAVKKLWARAIRRLEKELKNE